MIHLSVFSLNFRLNFTGLFLFLATFLQPFILKAQNVDSLMEIQAKADPQEKLYFQFDRNYYSPGETIWYKTYVFRGNLLNSPSKNLYLEIVNGAGKIVQKLNAPIVRSMAHGSIPVSFYFNEDALILRAYTIAMLNGDTSFLYVKAIPVIQKKLDTNATQINQKNKTVDFSNRFSGYKVKNSTPTGKDISLGLYPEGGDMVDELLSVVGFKFKNHLGFPYPGSGKIVNDKNEFITDFHAEHDGMGSFALVPKSGEQYYALWQLPDGSSQKTPFPPANAKGVILRVIDVNNGKRFTIARSPEVPANEMTLFLIGSMNQKVVYQARINLNIETGTLGLIPTDHLPTGILQLTLLDSDLRPLAERVTFIKNKNSIASAEISLQKPNKAKRGLNEGIITLNGEPSSIFSLSITDADLNLNSVDQNNLISHVLLTSDLRGKIYNPWFYFQNNSDSINKFLDLVMLTHGWRRYNWELLFRGRAYEGGEKESNYISLQGKIAGLKPSLEYEGMKINFLFRTEDSATNVLSVPLNKRGELYYDGLIFYGFAKIYYQANGSRLSFDPSQLYLNNGLYLSSKTATLNPEYKAFSSSFDARVSEKIIKNYNLRQSVDYARTKNEYNLKEVVIKAQGKTHLQKLDEEYATGIFSGSDARSFDVANDPFAQGAFDIFQYLQSRVPGLQISIPGSGDPSLSWRGGKPTLYLDGSPADISLLKNISLTNIAYIKVFDPGSAGVISNSGGGVIAIFTKKGGADKVTEPGMSLIKLAGYSPYKEFSSPDYSTELGDNLPDYRPTLYWNPNLYIERGKHSVHFKFYNNDFSRHFKMILEGVNDQSQLIHTEHIF